MVNVHWICVECLSEGDLEAPEKESGNGDWLIMVRRMIVDAHKAKSSGWIKDESTQIGYWKPPCPNLYFKVKIEEEAKINL